jgi:hypothetical protein
MPSNKSRNLGSTGLKARWRSNDPMQAYDALPTPLRHWLSQAALPWSPTSAKRVWSRARAKGMSVEGALQTLERAESKTLARSR